jgi:hypothetical protein
MSKKASVIAALALLAFVPAAWANGAGSLFVSGASHTPTHWNIEVGVAVKAEIHGVDPSEVGGSLPATLDVWVKSSVFGNTQLTATQIGTSSDYTFTYTPPAVAIGDPQDACGTTIVAYYEVGQNANNDYCDDDLKNGSTNAASGFRYYDSNGSLIDCTVGVEQSRWDRMKSLYRD